MILVWLWGGCGLGGPPDPIRSVPNPPVVELTKEGPVRTTMVWSDLAEMFPVAPGMARPLEALKPGAAAAEVRQVLTASAAEGAGIMDGSLAEHPTLTTLLRHGTTDVPVTVVLDPAGRALKSVDLEIEWPSASAVLVERWGDPEPGAPLVNGRALSRWAAAPWTVELHRLPEGAGILHYEAVKPAE